MDITDYSRGGDREKNRAAIAIPGEKCWIGKERKQE